MITKQRTEPKIEEGGGEKCCPGCGEFKSIDMCFGYRLVKNKRKDGTVNQNVYQQSYCTDCRSKPQFKKKPVETAETVPPVATETDKKAIEEFLSKPDSEIVTEVAPVTNILRDEVGRVWTGVSWSPNEADAKQFANEQEIERERWHMAKGQGFNVVPIHVSITVEAPKSPKKKSVGKIDVKIETTLIHGSAKHKPDQVEEFRSADAPKPEEWMSPWDKKAIESVPQKLRDELVKFIDRLNESKHVDDHPLMDAINDWLVSLETKEIDLLLDYMTATDPGMPENGWFNYGYNQMEGFLQDERSKEEEEEGQPVEPISSREDLTALYRAYFPDDKGNSANTFRPVKFMADKLCKKFTREGVNASLVERIRAFVEAQANAK